MTLSPILSPLSNELPSEFADRLGEQYTKTVTQLHKKAKGQFFTPLKIARFMGTMAKTEKHSISILDPGSGTGILTCSIVEHLIIANSSLKEIFVDLFEIDAEVIPFLEACIEYLKKWSYNHKVKFIYNIHEKDFILMNGKKIQNPSLDLYNEDTNTRLYDFAISNPPYFKLSKDDPRSRLSTIITSGQNNIYSTFMAVTSSLLKIEGRAIFITPRSFASGSYFKAFREYFFNHMQINWIHLFASRKDTFKRDSVLQETIIIQSEKRNKVDSNEFIKVTSSNGSNDLKDISERKYMSFDLIDLNSEEKILHVPISNEEDEIFKIFRQWPNRLKNFNIQISTGPVVSFRAKCHLHEKSISNVNSFAPLIWLHNVSKFKVNWPDPKPGKGQYINIDHSSVKLLIPNKNYVLLRRFSSKDDKSRLIAAPLFKEEYISEYLGIENKVNYIYRINGELSKPEVIGITALLNSTLFDKYFRIFNGNVNVSATELRVMPFPPLEKIIVLGNEIEIKQLTENESINKLVNDHFGINTF